MSKDSHSVHLFIPSSGLTVVRKYCCRNKSLSQETWNKIPNENAILVLCEWPVSKDILRKIIKHEQKNPNQTIIKWRDLPWNPSFIHITLCPPKKLTETSQPKAIQTDLSWGELPW